MFDTRTSVGLAVLICVLMSPLQRAQADLALHDDFNSATLSANRWNVDTSGAGTVSFTGGQAVLDMSSPTSGKAARLVYPNFFTLTQLNGQLHLTWDQQILQDNINGFDSGFVLTSGGTMLFDAGQIGRENDGVVGEPFLPHHFIINLATTAGTFGTVDGGTSKHHFDLSVTTSAVTLSTYPHNSAYDLDPNLYLPSGTLLETLNQSVSISPSAILSGVFFNETQIGGDPHLIQNMRAVIAIDNVYTNIPEPSITTAMALSLLFLRGHRHSGRRSCKLIRFANRCTHGFLHHG